MPDGAHPARLLSSAEALSHAQILDLIEHRLTYATHERSSRTTRQLADGQAERRFTYELGTHLLRFAPRCCCGLPLVMTAVTGRTLWRCQCGVSGVTA